MIKKRALLFALPASLLAAGIVFTMCKPSAIVVGKTVIYPQAFPTTSVTGIQFPTDSNTINGWVNNSQFAGNYDSASIYSHAWGIWAGLTSPTNQISDSSEGNLLVFETWMGLNEVYDYIVHDSTCTTGKLTKRGRAPLTRPKQFEHAKALAQTVNSQRKKLLVSNAAAPNNLWVTVSYSPDQACHAINNKLFKQSVINKFYTQSGVGNIPQFPNTSIMVKPTYLEYDADATLLQMPVWLNAPNPPDSLNVFTGPTNATQFPFCVYVDVTNKQPKDKILIPVTTQCTTPDSIQGATCNLSDFINFRIDSTMAAFMNQQDSVQGMNNGTNGFGKAKRGNRVLLVAMHVSTKEITNWTWQSFFWAPNPSNPGTPSSTLASGLMPSQVQGAARHYAANAAYVMLMPNNASNTQPGALAMFGYNPYLEGGFGPSTFPFPNAYNANFKYGMQSNCMSCHALALPNPSAQYTTDQYIAPNNPYYTSQVKLDFAWSIQTALINDTIPYWKFTNSK